MNPLTNVRNIQNLNKRELELNVPFTQSWHQQYKDSAWIFIGGLDYDLTEGDIICLFSQYGEVVNVNLVRDKKSGKSKGFAFLCYENQVSTVLSVDNLNSIKLCGRTIRVDHVEEYKVPKMREDMAPEQVKLALEGCAPSLLPREEPLHSSDIKESNKQDNNSAIKQEKKKSKRDKPSRFNESLVKNEDPDVETEPLQPFDDVDLPPRLFGNIIKKEETSAESKTKKSKKIKKSKVKKSKKSKKSKKKRKESHSSDNSSDSDCSSDSEDDNKYKKTHKKKHRDHNGDEKGETSGTHNDKNISGRTHSARDPYQSSKDRSTCSIGRKFSSRDRSRSPMLSAQTERSGRDCRSPPPPLAGGDVRVKQETHSDSSEDRSYHRDRTRHRDSNSYRKDETMRQDRLKESSLRSSKWDDSEDDTCDGKRKGEDDNRDGGKRRSFEDRHDYNDRRGHRSEANSEKKRCY